MSFVEELRASKQKAIEDTALTVSINIQPKLKEFAEKGQSECFMNIPNEQAELLLDDEFIKLLSELLDGINVEVVERNISSWFSSIKRKDIRFSW